MMRSGFRTVVLTYYCSETDNALAYKTVLEKDAIKEANNLSIKDVYIKYK